MSDPVDADLLSDLRFRSTGSSGVDKLCGRALARIEALEARNREHEERYMDKEAVSPESLSAEERLIWLLGDLMNAAENYFGAENPKRLGHIDCAAARIIDEIIAPIQADLADAIAENTNLHAEIVKLRLARALVAKGGGDE